MKKLNKQVVVITGASSGIGLATARRMAQKGAKVVLAARSENALRELTQEIGNKGGQAKYVVADVSQESDVARIAEVALMTFGGFDTWINNAAVGMYGTVEEIPVADMKKLYDTNVWGVVYGSKEAIKHFRKVGGGTLINVGSTVSEAAIPLQGVYSSTKHAVKAFTDALRMELEADKANIVVTLIKPGPIDTPFPMNAKNYLDSEPKHVPPVYEPKVVAEAICHCAENPTRDIFVGGGGKGNASIGYHAPRLGDKLGEMVFMPRTPSGKPKLLSNALDAPSERLSERGDYDGHVKPVSLYTLARLHPVAAAALLAGTGFLLTSLLRPRTPGLTNSLTPAPELETMDLETADLETIEVVTVETVVVDIEPVVVEVEPVLFEPETPRAAPYGTTIPIGEVTVTETKRSSY